MSANHGQLYRLRFGAVAPDTTDPDVLWIDQSTDPPTPKVYVDGSWVSIGGATGATDAADVAFVPVGEMVATDVQAGMEELYWISFDHIFASNDAHHSTAINYTPTGSPTNIDVQQAIDEDRADIAALESGKAASVHNHVIGDVTALQAALDAKADDSDLANYSPTTHDHTFSYPNAATIWADEAKTIAGTAMSLSPDSTQLYGYRTLQNPAANGDTLEWRFHLAAGTYLFSVLGQDSPNRAICKWQIDGADVVTGQDWYNAAGGANKIKADTVAVTTDGAHTLRMVVTGKNASSSDYHMTITKMWLRPS